MFGSSYRLQRETLFLFRRLMWQEQHCLVDGREPLLVQGYTILLIHLW